jgi:O-antigen ligase
MPRSVPPLRLERLIPFVLAASIFAFACGSSSVARVQTAGRPARWILLVLLLALALAAARRERNAPQVPRTIIGAAAILVVLAFASVIWSVDPRSTFERAMTLAVLFATVTALAQVRSMGDRLMEGIVGGAAAVAIAGLVVLAVRHADAVQEATRAQPTRYQGLGQDPNTVPLLLAPCLALVVWLFVRSRSGRRRILLAAIALLFDGSIVASGSRGAMIAAFAGVAVVVLLHPARLRWRAVLVAATTAVLAVSVGLAQIPKSAGVGWRPPVVHTVPPGSHPKPGYVDVEAALPLSSDIGTWLGSVKPAPRTLFGLSGRGEAWRGAIDLGDERPVAGYGFGTESRVFVDRWVEFAGGLPENSYIGIYLQLGVVGLLALVAILGLLACAAIRRPRRWEVAGPAGVLAAGVLLAFVQSYLYSVGDIATVAVWTAAFVASVQPERRAVHA